MAKSIIVWNPKTGQKKRMFTVDVKEMLEHKDGDLEVWSESAEIRAAKAQIKVEATPPEIGSEPDSAGFADNVDPADLDGDKAAGVAEVNKLVDGDPDPLD